MESALNRDAAKRIDWEAIEEGRDARRIPDLRLDELLPRILPAGWRLHQGGKAGDDGAVYIHGGLRLSVIVSFARETDGKRWGHFSIAHPDREPTWQWIREAKDLFVGRHQKAIMVLPGEAEYINIHKNCFHLFWCLDADSLPDFTMGNSL